jgi:SAM-dependent methyltransferase
MNANVFDQVARDYETIHNRSLPPGVQSADFIAQRVAHVTQWILTRNKGEAFAYLDFGCGNGRMLKGLLESGGLKDLIGSDRLRLYGFDTSEESLREARGLLNDRQVTLIADWGLLPETLRFDLVVSCHVFHHIPPDRWPETVTTLHHRMKPNARIVIWEHNPFNPATRVLVKMCPFDGDARLLTLGAMRRIFGGPAFRVDQYAYVNVLPPRWLRSRHWRNLEAGLSRLPIGAQYWAMFRRDE